MMIHFSPVLLRWLEAGGIVAGVMAAGSVLGVWIGHLPCSSRRSRS